MIQLRCGLRPLQAVACMLGVLVQVHHAFADPPGDSRLERPILEGDQVRFRWKGGGDLQVAPSPMGPWTTVRSPGSRTSEALHPAIRNGQFFFRVLEGGVPGTAEPVLEGHPARPFTIQRATARHEEHPDGNAVLEATLVPGQDPPPVFPVVHDERLVVLRDDGAGVDRVGGDGIFSGVFVLDIEDLKAANEAIRQLPPEFRALGGFDGRRLTRGILPTLFDDEAFERGEPVLLHPSPILGRGLVPDGFPSGRAAVVTAVTPQLREVCVTNIQTFTNIALAAVAVSPGSPGPIPPPVTAVTNLTLVTNIVCETVEIDPVPGDQVVEVPVEDVLRRPDLFGKSLMITDLSVVEDPSRTFDPCTGRGTRMGVWTFGRLMADMCNPGVTGIDPSDFTRRWLRSWQSDQVINFDRVAERNREILEQVIQGWETASGGPDRPLDLSLAPFRLLAIVNRVDLRLNPGYGGGVAEDPCNPPCVGGEARFVFGLIADAFAAGGTPGPDGGYGGGGGGGGTDGCGAAPFTVIFEYCVPRRTCSGIQEWGGRWLALSRMDFGGPFNAALQTLTDEFAGPGADPSRRPNLSALSQLRANDLLREPWEMREWRLFPTDSDAGWLREVTAKRTPAIVHNGTSALVAFCQANAADILAGRHDVPLEWRAPGSASVPFLGGAAPMDTERFFWDGPAPAGSSLPTEVRHRFSLDTCNGCHAGETGTPFTHVFPRAAGAESALSDFLTGRNMPKLDPADGVTPRFFADLKRREDDLLRLVLEPCFLQVLQEPVRFEH